MAGSKPSSEVQSDLEAGVPNRGPQDLDPATISSVETNSPKAIVEGLVDPVVSDLGITTIGELHVQLPVELCSVVPEPCSSVMYGCETFEEWLTIFDDSDLELLVGDLQDLCNTIRKEILVIARLQGQFQNDGQGARAAGLQPRAAALEYHLATEELRYRKACTLRMQRTGVLPASSNELGVL